MIVAIYACITSDDAMHRCLQMLASRFDCNAAALVYRDERRSAADIAFGYGVVDAAAQALSQPAAALTVALIAGDDLARYAQHAGITLNTVKFHLKGAFAATGTGRQADLVRRALAVIGDIS